MPSHQSNRYDQIQWFRSILLPQRASRWKYKSVYKQKKQSVIRNFKGSPKFVNLFTFTFTTFFNRRFYSRCSQMFSYIFFVMNGDARGESKREREREREWEREWESECMKERENERVSVWKREREWLFWSRNWQIMQKALKRGFNYPLKRGWKT